MNAKQQNIQERIFPIAKKKAIKQANFQEVEISVAITVLHV